MRKLAMSLAIAGTALAASVAGQTTPAAARTDVHLGFGVNVGVPGYYYGPGWGYVGYYPPPVYYGPRWRVRCHNRVRRVRYWHRRHHHWHWRVVRTRTCHRYRVW